eukprot:COSAG01_NODE_451_length_16883_cov_55.881733_6_plen_388_part_00
MPGPRSELVGVLGLSGMSLAAAFALLVAASDAAGDGGGAGLVAFVLAVIGLMIAVAAVTIGGWSALEWSRAQRPGAARVLVVSNSADRRTIHSLREALSQPVFVKQLVQTMIIAGTANMIFEWKLRLQECPHIQILAKGDPGHPTITSDARACHNYGLMRQLFGPHEAGQYTQYSMYTETLTTSYIMGFFTTFMPFGACPFTHSPTPADDYSGYACAGAFQNGVLGLKWNFACTGARGEPTLKPLDDALLDRWFMRPWGTGRRGNCCCGAELLRKRIWVRASLLAFQMFLFWSFVLIFGALAVEAYTPWDGSMRSGPYVAFKTLWCTMEAAMCVTVSFVAATSEKSVLLIRKKFGIGLDDPGTESHNDLGTPLRGLASMGSAPLRSI